LKRVFLDDLAARAGTSARAARKIHERVIDVEVEEPREESAEGLTW